MVPQLVHQEAHHNFRMGFTKPHRYLNSKAFWKVAECLTMAVVLPCTTKDMMARPPWAGAWVACPPLHFLAHQEREVRLVAALEAYMNSMGWDPPRICLIQVV